VFEFKANTAVSRDGKETEAKKEEPQFQKLGGSDTESDNEFDDGPTWVSNLDIGELAGKVQPSLLMNVNYKSFSRQCGFEPIDQNINILNKEPIVEN